MLFENGFNVYQKESSWQKRVFQDKLENMYFVTEVKGKVQCLICLQTIAVLKEYNVRRHYITMHSETYDVITEEMRKEK